MANFNAFLEKLQQKYGFEYFGIYVGVYDALVVRNDDPEERGRIQMKCPSVGHNTVLRRWVDPSFPYAGRDFGQFWPPEVGTTVRVSFANGDPSKPELYWGGWFAEGEVPSEFRYTNGRPQRRGIVTRAGHSLTFVDQPGSEAVRLVWHKPADGDPSLTDPEKAADRTTGDFAVISFEPDGSIQLANSKGSRIDLSSDSALLMLTHESGASLSMDSEGIKAIGARGNLISIGTDGQIVVSSSDTVHLTAQKVNLRSGSVFLGDQAAQSVVLGEAFQTLFNAHTHPTGTGPSGPPITPMTPAQLSSSVKTKS